MSVLTPYDWQLKDQEILRAGNFTGLVAIEAGGGKSLTATLALKEVRPDVALIVAPQSTHNSAWIPTLQDNADTDARIIGNSTKAQRDALFDLRMGYAGTYLTTPQLLTRADISDWSGSMVILDESHQVATAKSKAQRKISGYHHSDGQPLSRRFEHRLALSGTPMRQDFANMWATMRFLYPHLDGRQQIADDNFFMWQNDRQDFVEIYTNQKDQWGQPKKVKKYLAEAVAGRLLSEIPTVVMHKRREYCCPWHPNGFLPTNAPQELIARIDLTAKQKRAIREMENLMMTWLDDNPLQADISLTQKQRIRQLTLGEASAIETDEGKTSIRFDKDCVSPFVDESLHILSKLPADEPVVVFLESQQFAEVAVHQFNKAGIRTAEYSGVRKADLTRFGKDYRVLVGVVSSIGTGTAGLNHIANTEIVMEQPVSLTMKTQSEARLDRLDNRKQVQRFILLDSEGVQEGRLGDLVEKKLLVNRSLRKVQK